MELQEIRDKLKDMYGGENKPITDGNYDPSLAVRCINGTFVGRKTENITVFRGIPYATQPLGKLRWQKPLPAADDDGVYDATKPGHIPIGPINDSNGTAEFGEDCLVLNIYCNTSCTDSKKPVMVGFTVADSALNPNRSPSTTLAISPSSTPTSCSCPSTTGSDSWDS